MSKFIKIKQVKELALYDVINKKTNQTLGQIYKDGAWNKWVFYSIKSDYIYDAKCLQDITNFLKELK